MKMIKSFTVFSVLLFLAGTLFAQVSEGSQSFVKKESGNALTLMVEGQPKNVSEVLDRIFKEETNTKPKSTRGVSILAGGEMKTFTAARYADISSSSMDYTYRVEKAKGSKDQSVVHMWISTGNNNFIDSRAYPDEIMAAREMLEGLQFQVTVYEFELMIGEQEKVASNAVKEFDKMVKDSIKLQDELARLLQDIEDNKRERANQTIVVADEEQKLADFRLEFEELKRRGDGNMNYVPQTEEASRSLDRSAKKGNNNNPEREPLNETHRGQTTFDIMLLDAGDSKFNVIKELKSITGLGMRESKKLVDASSQGPVKIIEGVSYDEADVIKAILEEAGAKVELK